MHDVKSAYTIIVSSIPSLYRSWRDARNGVARLMNRVLLDRAIEFAQEYQRTVQGCEPDDYSEYQP